MRLLEARELIELLLVLPGLRLASHRAIREPAHVPVIERRRDQDQPMEEIRIPQMTPYRQRRPEGMSDRDLSAAPWMVLAREHVTDDRVHVLDRLLEGEASRIQPGVRRVPATSLVDQQQVARRVHELPAHRFPEHHTGSPGPAVKMDEEGARLQARSAPPPEPVVDRGPLRFDESPLLDHRGRRLRRRQGGRQGRPARGGRGQREDQRDGETRCSQEGAPSGSLH